MQQEVFSPATFRPTRDVMARRLGDGAVLVHLRTTQIFELNESGARIWELLTQGLQPEQVISRLLEEFDVDRARLEPEVADLLGRLRREGLVE